MTKDVIALTPKMPDTWAMLAGLYAGGPDLEVSATADGAVIQLCGPGGRPLVSVEAPVLVQVPGEAARLLGDDVPVPDVPFWWTEARASTATPEAERLAGSVCGRLNTLLGGTTWPHGAATTEVVEAASTALPAPGDAQPAVDVLTESTAVVLTDRPVVALTSWLSDVLRATAESGRALQIVTPPDVRLSLPTRTSVTRVPNRWVVQDPECGYFDGLSGAVLRWQDGTFAPALTRDGKPAMAKAFTRSEPKPGGRRLIVAFRTLRPADEHLVLGRALETAWHVLTGAVPAGWGTAEPVNLPWSTRRLTDLARERAPEPTQLIAIGHPDHPTMATLRVTRTQNAVEEDITLTLGYGEDETPPLHAVEKLAEALVAEHGLATMLTSLHNANHDLTTSPRLEAPPIPVAFTLGADDIRGIGLTHA
ncbi:hypothetical protein G5C60_07855, partial [Streptomyces sp. HC44]|nr:hypothetical protein [Streptomyces scabichelini]